MRIYQVDAFADRPFAGNPAGVCMLGPGLGSGGPIDTSWMQLVAAEMNVAETAFLSDRNDGYNLRWFTPIVEVDLCGHATLASAHILWETGAVDSREPISFMSRSGLLEARRDGEWIELDFPAEPVERAPAPEALLSGLQVTPRWTGKTRNDYLLEVDSEETLRRIRPDMAVLSGVACQAIIVTSRSASPAYDFVSRVFAPAMGIDEDPVTGSAHCVLAPFWRERLGHRTLTARQASKRGGELRLRLREDRDRVLIAGRAVTVLSGELRGF
jgi:predicted PhzF superfamily epimerase YddE/YHI9